MIGLEGRSNCPGSLARSRLETIRHSKSKEWYVPRNLSYPISAGPPAAALVSLHPSSQTKGEKKIAVYRKPTMCMYVPADPPMKRTFFEFYVRLHPAVK